MKKPIIYLCVSLLLMACSTTSSVPEDDWLYTGLDDIKYDAENKSGDHYIIAQTEIEAALACAPNGALFGSSYYRTPFPYGLWIWNATEGKDGPVSNWLRKSFGKEPVLMSWVNPELRASVAQNTLKNNGYFRGSVDYDIIQQKNPRQQKIGYKVDMGHLFTLDTIKYVGFSSAADSLIATTEAHATIHQGDGFSVSALDAERSRISQLFRNNGYYYYQPAFTTYLADTLMAPGKVQLQLHQVSDIPEEALRPWSIGKIDITVRRNRTEEITTHRNRRRITVHHGGKTSPLRMRNIMTNMKLRSGQLYNQDLHIETVNRLNTMGMFSQCDVTFSKRDTTSTCDTLDVALNAILGEPYSLSLETDIHNKSNGFIGPTVAIGITRNNLFHGGEKLSFNLHGGIEWNLMTKQVGANEYDHLNTYEYGGDVTLEIPRLLFPGMERKRFTVSPSTVIKLDAGAQNRSGYFRMNTFGAELTYKLQTSPTLMHEFTPLMVDYQQMAKTTERFDSIVSKYPYLEQTMRDKLIPRMRYTIIYTSPSSYLNPIRWETTISEAGNVLSLGYLAAGKDWNQKDKELFKTPYSQFVKITTDLVKTWRLTEKSELVGHVNAGYIWCYGNSNFAPYSEEFYVGGANSIRAFNVRGIGPGRSFTGANSQEAMTLNTGTMKLQLNMEYRFNLFGSLNAAVFADAGNVWDTHTDDDVLQRAEKYGDPRFRLNHLLGDLATCVGLGIRYDLDFLVIRLDWGLGLHVPYSTSKSGYFNIPTFRDAQALHFAVGYPF